METNLEQIEIDIKECENVLEGEYDNDFEIADIGRLMVANYHNEIDFHHFAHQGTSESLKIIITALKKYKKHITEENKSKKDDVELYKLEIKYYKEKIKSIEEKLDKLINSMLNINIINSMAQSQEIASTIDVNVQIDNLFSDIRKKSLNEEVECRDELLKKLDELESVLKGNTSNEIKEGKIKSTLTWLGTKSKNTIQLVMPLLQILLEKSF